MPIALPLLIAPLLHALSPLVAVLSPTLLSTKLLRLVLLGSWAPLFRLCDCSWALGYLVLCPAALGRSPGLCAFFLGRCVVSNSAVRLLFRLCLGSWALLRPERDCSRCFAAYRSVALDRSFAPFVALRGWYAASCSTARGAPTALTPWLMGAPPPLVRLLLGAWPLIVLPLLTSPLLRALSVLVAVLPPTLLLVGHRRRLRLGSWALFRFLCDCSWTLCRLSFCRARSSSCSVRRFSGPLYCRLPCCSWGSVVAYAWACGRPSTLRAATLGRCAAVCSAAPGWCPAPRAILRGCCAASCFSALGGLLSLTPGFVGAPPPLVRPLVGASLPCALPFLFASLLRSFVRRVSRSLCRLVLLCSWGSAAALAWARGRYSALCATVRARFADFRCSALGRSSALCAVVRCYYAASASIAPEAPLSPMSKLTGAPLPLVRRLVGALPLVAPPLLVATPLRVPSSNFPVLPPALLPVGLRCRLCLGPWALLRPLCDCPGALCCLKLRHLWSLRCLVGCLSTLLWCLLLWRA